MSRHVPCIALVVTTLTACVQTQDTHSPAAQALADLRASAEAGEAAAQRILGGMYVTGVGVPQDDAEAVAWYRRAAAQGDARAQYNLGAMYADGVGVPQDAAEAVAWYRRAAEQGDAAAQSNLGAMYDQGVGVPPDAAAAVAWYRRAAEQGHVRAQYNLGGMYAEGLGVPPDDVEALMWLTLAATRSIGAEREHSETVRAAVAARMPPTDVREAERRAQAWLAAHPDMRDRAAPPSDTGRAGVIIALGLLFAL